MNKQIIDINCDMGEGFGRWHIADNADAQLLPFISSVNLAAGFHAGDPNLMAHTIELAKQHGLKIGAHPGYRDLVGFGRRPIQATAIELVNDVIYQMGAVREFLALHQLPLNHLKLHGALYMHAAANHEFAECLIEHIQRLDAKLPVLTMAGCVLDEVGQQAGQPLIYEFFADRHYNADGQIVFTRDVGKLEPEQIAQKVLQACQKGTVDTVEGKTIPIAFDSICLHSDTTGVLPLMQAMHQGLLDAGIAIRAF